MDTRTRTAVTDTLRVVAHHMQLGMRCVSVIFRLQEDVNSIAAGLIFGQVQRIYNTSEP